MITLPLAAILAFGIAGDTPTSTAESAVILDDYAPCGLISLYLVCQLREVPVTWEQVKEAVGTPGANGVLSFADLSVAAAKLGLHPVGLDANRAALADLPMPVIVQVHDKRDPKELPHFLVLLRLEADGVWLLDAPYPAYFLPESRFQESWT